MTYAEIIKRHPELTYCRDEEVLALMAYLAGGIDALNDFDQKDQELAGKAQTLAANKS